MSVTMEYSFRSTVTSEIAVHLQQRPSGRWVVLPPCDPDWDELEAADAHELGACFLAAADKCEELNRETKP